MRKKAAKGFGIYRINDNIERLQIKIELRHVESMLELPQYTPDLETPRSSSTVSDKKTKAKANSLIKTIKWQQKLFSPQEKELYKDELNCKSEQQKLYHRMIREDESQRSSVSSKSKRRNRKNAKHKAKDLAISLEPKNGITIFTYVHEDDFDSSKQFQRKFPSPAEVLVKNVVCMYVCATLNPDTVLVTLKWYPKDRNLYIQPDFNCIEVNPHFIEIDSDYRHLYSYSIKNISFERPANEEKQLNNIDFMPMHKDLVPYWQREAESAEIFDMPPKRKKRVCLFFEIRKAQDFEYDNVHVRYHIDLPKDCVLEEGLLDASTHSSRLRKTETGEKSHYFGYNWQLSFLCPEEHNAKVQAKIYFEVISIDFWDRERYEGFAYLATLFCPGSETHIISCIRPVDSFMDSVYRYFLGGRQLFDYKRFFDIEDDVKVHMRYRCQMQQSGKLEISIKKLTQSNLHLTKPQTNRPMAMTLDDIMMAFREATSKLKALTV